MGLGELPGLGVLEGRGRDVAVAAGLGVEDGAAPPVLPPAPTTDAQLAVYCLPSYPDPLALHFRHPNAVPPFTQVFGLHA